MRKKNRESRSMGLGVVFIAIVVVLVTISVAFKAFEVVKNSTFDGKSNYYILIPQSSGFEDIVFSPARSSIILLDYKTRDKSLASASLPYDLLSSTNVHINEGNIKSNIATVLKSSATNPFDFIKIILFVKQNSDIETIVVDSNQANDIKKLPQMISDPQISNENLTIEISNASGISGVGSVFAKMVTFLGGNVILVSTSDEVSQKSKIVSLESESPTVKKLLNMFKLSLDETSPALSDIKIVVGKDLLGKVGLR